MALTSRTLAVAGVLCAALVAAVVAANLNSAAQDAAKPQAMPWTPLRVPGTWDDNAIGDLQTRIKKYDGFAWYRCAITVPRGWKGKDLQLHVEKIDNAHEAYFNGVKVGGAGAFPPKYESGLAYSGRYTVPAKAVQPGKNNLLAIRVYDHDGRGGFKGAAPTLINGKQAIALNGRWEFRTGDDPNWAKGPAARTDVGIYWRVMDTADALKIAKGWTGLEPKAALKTFVVPDDLRIEQVLTEPVVRQPLFMNFDERGRLWVMQYIQYPYPAGLKMVSKDQFWRAVYDKVPLPPPHGTRGADKITIHEDTNGDGVFDRHTTFLDGLNIASSFARGRGGVWVLNPPYLLFYPDRDNDDQPDGPPEVHLQGFGMQDTHSVVNSLRWGPDGWLYAAQGSTVNGNVSRYGEKKPQPVYSMGQLIWRYHPETRRYEIFAEGGGNSFGVEIDAKGRIYSGHNGGNTRGFHYVQGAYYRKGFGKHGPLSNPYSFGFFEAMKHHAVQRFTHNFVIYEAGSLPAAGRSRIRKNSAGGRRDGRILTNSATLGLPAQYHGKLFGVEPMQGQVVQAEIDGDGSTFRTKDINRVVKTSDRRFRPVDIKVGPDGAIYVADLYEPQISHREHFSGQIDKSDGRIYRLVNARAKSRAAVDLGKKTTRELVDLLAHPNKWYRQSALRLIGDRRDKSMIPLLKIRIAESDGQLALECLWALNLSGGLDDAVAAKTLGHDDPFVRLWTVRLLCDDHRVSPAIAKQLAALAKSESYVEVRSQLACSAKRLPAGDGLPIVRNLLAHSEDASDPHLPLLLWWAMESKAKSDPQAIVDLFKDAKLWSLPIVKQTILERVMRRFAQSGTRNDLLMCAELFAQSPGNDANAVLMRGFEAAFKGRPLTGLPAELTKQLSKAGGGSLTFRVRQGDKAAVKTALAAISNAKTPLTKRIEYAQVFGEVREPASVPVLLRVLGDAKSDKLQMTILTALQPYKDDGIATTTLSLYGKFSPDVRAVAQTLLVSRPAWNRLFLEAVDAGKIDRKTIPLDVVRQMTLHRDERIAALVKKHWKDIRGATTAEMQAAVARFQKVLAAGSGDPYKGKLHYNNSCGKCHILFGGGGRIGPDLTAFKRDDTTRMLINIVNPSAEIREGFETYLVVTEDGRTVTGFLFDRDNRVVVVRGTDGQNITIPRDKIEAMVRQKKSLMPEGLLKELSEQQVRDLFAYLKSAQPLNN